MLKWNLYQRANMVQRHDAQEIIKEYSKILHFRLDGNDSLLDVGTGSGDVLMDFVLPILPKNFKKIIGSDISPEMVQHCNETYKSQHMDKVDFKILDIETKDLPEEFLNKFDHVTSFYCLHWIQSQRQAMDNIYQILGKDGDCLLVFLASHQFADIYNILSNIPKWAPYMKDTSGMMSQLLSNKDHKNEFGQIFQDVGFVDYSVEVRDKIFIFDSLKIMKENARAVNPFINRMPIELHEEFMDEIINRTIELNSSQSTINGQRFIISYKLVVAYARK